mgnify:CR=1 FL=1
MRRLVVVSALLFPLLVGCSRIKDPPHELPEEVLRRAAQASLRLESARYVLKGSFTSSNASGTNTSGTVDLEGMLQDAGDQLQFKAVIGITSTHALGEDIFSADVEVIVGEQQDLFLKLNNFASEGSSPLFNEEHVKQFTGQWWRIPSREEQPSSLSVTPDPRLLNAQAQVVTVVRDHGIVARGSQKAFRYDISLDQEKLLKYLRASTEEKDEVFDEASVRDSIGDIAADGEIWIDYETYYIQHLEWKLSHGTTGTAKDVTASFSVDFSDHDMVEPIVLPSDAEEFAPFMFLSIPPPLETKAEAPPQEPEEDMLQQFLQQGVASPSTDSP